MNSFYYFWLDTIGVPAVQSELEFVAWLQQQVPPHRQCELQLGDDCAIVGAQNATVVTTDMLVEGVHFISAETSPQQIGRKLMAVNLSDLAAMAASPVAAVISIALPRAGGYQLAVELYQGLLPMAERYDVAIAGGDTNVWDGSLVANLTLLGTPHPRGSVLRNTARPGDAIVVTGSLGGSLAGKHFDFDPRIEEAILLRERYDSHAGMDITDGLAIDLSRLIAASGCGAIVDIDALPISEAANELAAAEKQGLSPTQHALHDGEDFELLLTLPAAEAKRLVADNPLSIPVTIVGEITTACELCQRDRQGAITPLLPHGYEHRTTS